MFETRCVKLDNTFIENFNAKEEGISFLTNCIHRILNNYLLHDKKYFLNSIIIQDIFIPNKLLSFAAGHIFTEYFDVQYFQP